MNTRHISSTTAALVVLGLGANTALAGEPRQALEEITVNGAYAAAEYRDRQARFAEDMVAYAQTVDAQYRDRLQTRLEQAIHDGIVDAAADRPGIRGWLSRLFDRGLRKDRREATNPPA